jgi:carbamoyl-phosphate synthase large subunit
MSRRVLITSVGSGVGYGIVRSLRLSRRDYYIIGVNSTALSAGVFDCDAAYLVPPVSREAEFVGALVEIVGRERPDIIFPGRDPDLPVLAGLKPQLEEFRAFVMTGSHAAIQICNDKAQTHEVLSSRNMPFARTAADIEELNALINVCGFPLIAKPRFGSASLGVKVLFGEHDLAGIVHSDGLTVFQEYLIPEAWGKDKSKVTLADVMDGERLRQEEELSVQVILGYEGVPLGVFASKNSLHHGAPMAIEVVDDPVLGKQAIALTSVLAEYGLIGPCNLQAKQVAGGDYIFFEVNPRFTGITSTRAVMGFNEVEAVYMYFVEGELPPSFLNFDRRQCAYRYLTESVFPSDDLERLRDMGRWQASS